MESIPQVLSQVNPQKNGVEPDLYGDYIGYANDVPVAYGATYHIAAANLREYHTRWMQHAAACNPPVVKSSGPKWDSYPALWAAAYDDVMPDRWQI